MDCAFWSNVSTMPNSDQVKCLIQSCAWQTVFLSMSRREFSVCCICRLPPAGRRRSVFPYMFSRVVAKFLFFECSVTQLLTFLSLLACFTLTQSVVHRSAHYALSDTWIILTVNKLRICTWNVQGIHSPIKRRKILTCLKKDDIDVAMLQETHLDDTESLLWQGPFGQVIFSSFTTRSREMAVLMRKNLPFIISDCVKDLKGRYVIIKGTLQGQNIVLMNVYFPPAHPTTFLTKMFLDLKQRFISPGTGD